MDVTARLREAQQRTNVGPWVYEHRRGGAQNAQDEPEEES